MLEAMECVSESMELFGRSRMPDTEKFQYTDAEAENGSLVLTRCARDEEEGKWQWCVAGGC